MKTYARMKKQEVAAALQEFLDERPRALEHLTRRLAARSVANFNLDGTVESLVSLWRWVKSVLTERTAETLEEDASTSPSWVRYGIGTEPTLSPESIAVIDGVTSYLCRVVERGAPGAEWRSDTAGSSRTCGRTTRCWPATTRRYHLLTLSQDCERTGQRAASVG